MPLSASGGYLLEAGVADPSVMGDSMNVRLALSDSSVREEFGAGAIGYRYVVGSLRIEAPAVDTAWPQLI